MATANETMISSQHVKVVTPGNTDLPDHKAIWVGGTGTLVVTLADNTNVTIAGVQAGTLLPLRAKRILATSSATDILLWQ